jgi:hypothetical protein
MTVNTNSERELIGGAVGTINATAAVTQRKSSIDQHLHPGAASAPTEQNDLDLDLDLGAALDRVRGGQDPASGGQNPGASQHHSHAHRHPQPGSLGIAGQAGNGVSTAAPSTTVGGGGAGAGRRNKRMRVSEDARRRAVRACVGCRRLKEKCNGRQPCERCLRSGRPCTFSAVADPPGGMLPGHPLGGGGLNGGAASNGGQGMDSGNAIVVAVTPAPPRVPTSVATTATTSTASVISDTACGCARTQKERVEALEKIVGHFLGDVPMDLGNLHRIIDRIGSVPAVKAAQRTIPTSGSGGSGFFDREELEDLMLEEENFTVKTLSQSTAHYSGEFSHWNFSQKLRRRLSECLDNPRSLSSWSRFRPTLVPVLDGVNGNANSHNHNQPPGGGSHAVHDSLNILEYWRATQLHLPKSYVLSVVGRVPPRPIAEFLVHVYFGFAQTNCFFVEEGWLRSKLDVLYDSPSAVTSSDAAWVCSVMMVLAIGTQFAHMAAGPPPDAAANSGALGDGGSDRPIEMPPLEEDVGVTFYQNAVKLMPDIITIASLESVQACLLLAHYVLNLDTHGLAYTYLGLGIKMAIQNGMHRKYNGPELDPSIIETRNRLWWTAYTVER